MKGLTSTQISYRPATEADVPFLMELRHQTMDAHLRASGVEPTDEEHLRRVLFRFECASIVLFDSRPIGLLKVAREGRCWDLTQIQLVPEMQGRGVGAWLIRGVIAEARDAGASLKLDVLKANPARRLYEKLGFVVVAEGPRAFDMQLSPDA